MRKTLITLTAAVVLAAPAQAHDSPTDRVAFMRPKAAAFFPGADARCGRVRIVRVPWLRTGAQAWVPQCVIELDEATLKWDRQPLCSVLTHEFGHVDRTYSHVGFDSLDHSPDRTSIMYGKFLAEDRVPACNWLGWAEGKLAALRRKARALLGVARRTASASRRVSVQRRLLSVRARARELRVRLGP